MKGIAVTIICIFSVVIPIQSGRIAYTYNYDNFNEIFPQDNGVINNFYLFKYEDLDRIFDTEYEGTNVGGAFVVLGSVHHGTPNYKGYVVDITATFYCGSTDDSSENWLKIGVFYEDAYDNFYPCEERGWHYNQTLIPPKRDEYQNFYVEFQTCCDATINEPYGFDMVRITTSDTPPQLLQRDNNTSSNLP